jgi:hypothetical protein
MVDENTQTNFDPPLLVGTRCTPIPPSPPKSLNVDLNPQIFQINLDDTEKSRISTTIQPKRVQVPRQSTKLKQKLPKSPKFNSKKESFVAGSIFLENETTGTSIPPERTFHASFSRVDGTEESLLMDIREPPVNGIYAICDRFLHCPIVDCLDISKIDKSINESLNESVFLQNNTIIYE